MSKEAELTTKQTSDRLAILLSELDDLPPCETDSSRDKDDHISLSTISKLAEDGPEHVDMTSSLIDPHGVSGLIEDVASEPSSSTSIQTLVLRIKNASEDRTPNLPKSIDIVSQQSSAPRLFGTGFQTPSAPQPSVSEAVIQQEPELVLQPQAKPESDYSPSLPRAIESTSDSSEDTPYQELVSLQQPFFNLSIISRTEQATSNGSIFPMSTIMERCIQDMLFSSRSENNSNDIFEATSSALDIFNIKPVLKRSLSIEELIEFTSETDKEKVIIVQDASAELGNKAQATAPGMESQLPAGVEKDWTSSDSFIDWEHNKSSNRSWTDKEDDRSHSSVSDTPFTASSVSEGTKGQDETKGLSLDHVPIHKTSSVCLGAHTKQGIGPDNTVEKDVTIAQPTYDPVKTLNKRMTNLLESVPDVRQFITDRACVGSNLEADDEDGDYDCQSDGEVEIENTAFEDPWSGSEAESDKEVQLHEPFCDSFINHDPIANMFAPAKNSGAGPAQSDKSFLYDCKVCPRTNVADHALIEKGIVQQESIGNMLALGFALTRPQTSQGKVVPGKESNLRLMKEAPSKDLEIQAISLDELEMIKEEKGLTNVLADYPDVIEDNFEDQGHGSPTNLTADEPLAKIQPPTTPLQEAVAQKPAAPMAFHWDLDFTISMPKFSDCLLHGSIASYLGYRLFTAFRW